MTRILMIYLSVLTFAEFTNARISHADDAKAFMPGEIIYADMKPVVADGKGVPPKIIDLTKKPETTGEVSQR